MDRKKLIERLKVDAEWAAGQEWEAPICLQDDILGAISTITTLADKYKLLAQYASEKYNQCVTLEEENVQLCVELEREAAVDDLRGYCWCCVYGSRHPVWSNLTSCKYMRERGAVAAGGRGGKNCPHWEWCGPQKEDQK